MEEVSKMGRIVNPGVARPWYCPDCKNDFIEPVGGCCPTCSMERHEDVKCFYDPVYRIHQP